MERGGGSEDWYVDEEGNLSRPNDPLTPNTDEFGRDDPDTLEREARRREREQRRSKGSGKPRKEKRPKEPRQRKRRVKEPKPPKPPKEAKAPREPRERMPLRDRVAAARGPAAPKPPRPPRNANYRRRRLVAIALGIFGILAVWFLVALFQPFSGDGQGEGEVTVEIPDGADSGEIAELLDEQGVISSARLFELRLRLSGKSNDIQADTYALASGMSYGTVIDELTGAAGPAGPITVSVPEGYDRQQIADLVLPEGVSSDEYLQQTETAPKSFNPRRYGADSDSLEGFLFPATYELPANEAQRVPDLIDQQLRAFEDNISKVDMSFAKKKNLTPYDVLIIASMINKEVLVKKEAPLVASVIYNRLSQGIPLGIDATTRFETGNYTEQITQAQLDEDTPYNTRLNAGLTPGPIGNPGLAAIKAAARPANTDFIFFVVKPGTCGEHAFTASEAEFDKLAAEYQQALEEQGGSPTECPE